MSKMKKVNESFITPKRGTKISERFFWEKISNVELKRYALWSLEELVTHLCVHLQIIFLAKK